MAWIRIVEETEAQGLLARIYEASRQRAGRVFNIVKVQSNNPRVLQSSMGFYQTAMLADSALTRAQREMLAVVVSTANDCHY